MTSSPGFFSLGAAAAAGQTRLDALHTYWQIEEPKTFPHKFLKKPENLVLPFILNYG